MLHEAQTRNSKKLFARELTQCLYYFSEVLKFVVYLQLSFVEDTFVTVMRKNFVKSFAQYLERDV